MKTLWLPPCATSPIGGCREKCQIQVIVQMTGDKQANGESPMSASDLGAPENVAE